MRAWIAISLVAALAGCSSATQSDPKPPPPTGSSRIATRPGETVTLPTAAEAIVARATIAAPVAEVWTALAAAYEAVGIRVELVNSTALRMGNEALRVRRRVGDVPMVRLLSCGGTIGAPNAETFDITLYVVSQLSPAGAGSTTLATAVQASGRSPNFGGNDVSCASTGAIERRIAELVQEKVAKK